ncbi:hypothetical protein HPB50_007697 [Hyalomma asiaticum]|uniref:Uncharacterized protein n=1 Tax=Hyalomma asiaticum TaxID=266040 RepID=A0ACB7TE81_HYAAI|nr:hypothetical protein HPB50_007697 [Hyalomma asiaticum]
MGAPLAGRWGSAKVRAASSHVAPTKMTHGLSAVSSWALPGLRINYSYTGREAYSTIHRNRDDNRHNLDYHPCLSINREFVAARGTQQNAVSPRTIHHRHAESSRLVGLGQEAALSACQAPAPDNAHNGLLKSALLCPVPPGHPFVTSQIVRELRGPRTPGPRACR